MPDVFTLGEPQFRPVAHYITGCYNMPWRLFMTRRFAREAIAQGLPDESLRKCVQEFQQGLLGASLGGNLFKKRVAIGGKGKRGGLRTILAYRLPQERIFCIHIFAKSQRDNIDDSELEMLRKLGASYLDMDNDKIQRALDDQNLLEIRENANEEDA